jgi:hypothetical protein
VLNVYQVPLSARYGLHHLLDATSYRPDLPPSSSYQSARVPAPKNSSPSVPDMQRLLLAPAGALTINALELARRRLAVALPQIMVSH